MPTGNVTVGVLPSGGCFGYTATNDVTVDSATHASPGGSPISGLNRLPSDLGFNAWSFDPMMCGNAIAMTTGGRVYGATLNCIPGTTVGKLWVMFTTVGATLTASQCLIGLFDGSGNLLQTSADQSVAWVTSGNLGYLSASVTSTVITGNTLIVAAFYNGTTGPSFSRGVTTIGGPNGNTTSMFMNFQADTGRTTSFPATLGAKSATNNNFWFATSAS